MEFVVNVDLVCTKVSKPIRSDCYNSDRGEFSFYRECSFSDSSYKSDSIYIKNYVRDVRVFEFEGIPVVGKKYRLEFIYFTDMYDITNFSVGLPRVVPID